MKILIVHNYYQQAGGEDVVFAAETQMLQNNGHTVITYTQHNDAVGQMHPLKVAAGTIWSRTAYRQVRDIIQQQQPDIAHFHNTFMRISPSVYYACKREGVPVVQTLHNYRLLCPAATFYRDGKICEACLHSPAYLPAVQHGCYRQSRTASGVVAAMLNIHDIMRTWHQTVSRYIALSQFARDKFISAGFPADKIAVKPNFLLDDPTTGAHDGDYFLFVGRLTEEKGIRTLLNAWEALPDVPLIIAGDGPLLPEIQQRLAQRNMPCVQLTGKLPRQDVLSLMQRAQALIFPSEWYEGMPITILEAFACGTPVITSRLGVQGELVQDGVTGIHFTAGDGAALAQAVRQFQAVDSRPLQLAARQAYETQFTPEQNYEALLAVYRQAQTQSTARIIEA